MSKTTLKRELGLFETTIIGVGIIIGAGIYVLVGKAAGLTGPSVWISFVIAGIVAALTGLSYAELSSMFPRDSSEYYYVKKAFKREPLAFLTGWMAIIGGVIAASAVSLGFAGYFNYIFKVPVIITALFIIVLLSMINFMGIRKSAIIDTLFTIAAVGGLLFIIVIGLKNFGSVNYFDNINGLAGIFKSASLIFFAYIGFESIVRLSEETRDPSRTIPKAIILSIVISTILYIGVAIASISTLSAGELSKSAAPLAAVTAKALGGANPLIMAILAIFATLCTILAILLTTSRLLFGMAEEHSLPKSVGSVNPLTQTPGTAIFLVGLGALIFVLLGKIELVASIVDFMIFVIFILINLCVIALRYRYPDLKRHFKTPLSIGRFPILPPIAIAISVLMLLHIPLQVIATSLILIVLGLIVYEIINKGPSKKGPIDAYRSACLLSSIGLFMIGALILAGGFLVGFFWWTGFLWIILGAALFWYTYSVIFKVRN